MIGEGRKGGKGEDDRKEKGRNVKSWKEWQREVLPERKRNKGRIRGKEVGVLEERQGKEEEGGRKDKEGRGEGER